MKKKLLICCMAIILFALQACKQDKLGPVANDGTGPGPLTNVTVVNLNGAAKISYNLPKDPDILYVRAIYTSKQGEVRETKVSRYNSSLTVVGFGDVPAARGNRKSKSVSRLHIAPVVAVGALLDGSVPSPPS